MRAAYFFGDLLAGYGASLASRNVPAFSAARVSLFTADLFLAPVLTGFMWSGLAPLRLAASVHHVAFHSDLILARGSGLG